MMNTKRIAPSTYQRPRLLAGSEKMLRNDAQLAALKREVDDVDAAMQRALQRYTSLEQALAKAIDESTHLWNTARAAKEAASLAKAQKTPDAARLKQLADQAEKEWRVFDQSQADLVSMRSAAYKDLDAAQQAYDAAVRKFNGRAADLLPSRTIPHGARRTLLAIRGEIIALGKRIALLEKDRRLVSRQLEALLRQYGIAAEISPVIDNQIVSRIKDIQNAHRKNPPRAPYNPLEWPRPKREAVEKRYQEEYSTWKLQLERLERDSRAELSLWNKLLGIQHKQHGLSQERNTLVAQYGEALREKRT